MKATLLILFLLLFSSFANAQKDDDWLAFWDEENYLRGFKDKNGVVKIEPKFMGFTTALKFKNVIAVMEESNDTITSYYLLKNGKKFGTDSLYVWDNSFDCESEGFIRFRDSKSDKVGFFDSLGTVVIPALYDDASPFRNGLAVAISGAKKICWEGGEYSKENPCEHWNWSGGKSFLIDKKNNILIDNFEHLTEIDLYSMQINDSPSEDSTKETFKSINGKFYSFINFEKHFRAWLFDSLLTNLNKETLVSNSYDKINYWADSSGWVFEVSKSFIDKNYAALEPTLLELKKETADYFISIDGLNPYIYDFIEFEQYFDDCGNAKIWKHPVMHIVINHRANDDFYQNHFDFLKTDDGYKLTSITIRNNALD